MTEKLLAILSAVFGGGWLTQLLLMRYEKRRHAAQTRETEMDVEAKEDRLRDEKLSKAYDQISTLQTIVDAERDKWTAIAEELSAVKRELLHEKEARQFAELNKCTVQGCANRRPPRRQTNPQTKKKRHG